MRLVSRPILVEWTFITLAAGLVIAGSVLGGSRAVACGYHDPRALALGTLNWAFPNALYVRTAVWRAEYAGILPPRRQQTAPVALAFRRTALSLRMLAEYLSNARLTIERRPNLAIVLLDSVMWTRLVATPSGYQAHVHVRGPNSDDVVVVTSSQVISALIRGSLDAKAAEEHGLLRLYRRREHHDDVRQLLRAVSRAKQQTIEAPTVKRSIGNRQ